VIRAILTAGLLAVLIAVPAQAGDDVYFRDYNDRRPKIEPDRITLVVGAGALLRFKNLQPWRNWGSLRTRAKGRYVYNTCRPSCVDGNYDSTGVRVRLSRIRTCGSQRRYRQLNYNPKKQGLGSSKIRVTCSGEEDF
jgi:hypothetical protein